MGRYGPAGVRALGGGDACGVHGEGLTQGWGGRARAERTRNMTAMVVTLDVSKLSGWSNAIARCGVERRAWDRLKAAGGRARAERT